jgi:hypothetical protein
MERVMVVVLVVGSLLLARVSLGTEPASIGIPRPNGVTSKLQKP